MKEHVNINHILDRNMKMFTLPQDIPRAHSLSTHTCNGCKNQLIFFIEFSEYSYSYVYIYEIESLLSVVRSYETHFRKSNLSK